MLIFPLFSIQLGNDVTTFVTTKHRVFNMEEDLLHQGQIIYSDGHALMSTDGVTTDLIVGDPNSWGYIEGERQCTCGFEFSTMSGHRITIK